MGGEAGWDLCVGQRTADPKHNKNKYNKNISKINTY
jgi:hypothetical protein